MQKDSLKPKTKRIKARQVGRGGKRGKTSGRGHKGQKSRAGRKIRPAIRDFIKSIPKLRGHASEVVSVNKPCIVDLNVLEGAFSDGDEVSPKVLREKGLLKVKKGVSSKVKVKILSDGKITKKIIVSSCETSNAAREKIEKAGGKVKS